MKRIGLTALAVVLMLGADLPRKPDAKDDRAKLQGEWAMVSLEINGEPVDEVQVKAARLVVNGEDYTPVYDSKVISETISLDPATTPKAIDFTYTAGPRKGETVKGIYKLEGDRYTMCRPILAESDRPTQFACKPDSGLVLVVWGRVRASGDAKRMAIEVHRKELDGTWLGVLGRFDGKKVVEDEAKEVQLTISGERYTLVRGDKIDRGTSKIDPTRNPKTMDLTVMGGEFEGQTLLGIYEVVGDTHKACFSTAGKARPVEFASEPGSGQILWVFARAKP